MRFISGYVFTMSMLNTFVHTLEETKITSSKFFSAILEIITYLESLEGGAKKDISHAFFHFFYEDLGRND